MAERKIYHSIAELVGETPLVEVTNYEKEHELDATILAKLEYFNPSGSVKDRAALAMIRDAEKKGKIKPGDTIMDFSSGNTGIALAAYANALGYKFAVILQPGVSEERTQILKAYGAIFLEFKDIPGVPELIAEKGLAFDAFYDLLQKYADEHGWYYINQGRNPENPKVHIASTGPEIWEATGGNIDYLVALVGTGGSLIGIGKYLKEKNPEIQIVGVEPASSPLLTEHKAGPHGIQGIGANFVPNTLNTKIYDEILTVKDEDAYKTGRMMAHKEGMLVGISSGASVYAAMQLAKREENKGKMIVAILPDTGERYLSTPMFE